jgi:hypothetical protein
MFKIQIFLDFGLTEFLCFEVGEFFGEPSGLIDAEIYGVKSSIR